MFFYSTSVLLQIFSFGLADYSNNLTPDIIHLLRQSRRILNGHNVGETRPYMVYLRKAGNLTRDDKDWLCGGVIIHEEYIITSAACIEDAKQFYVISGTSKWMSHDDDDDCIKYGAKRAIWKCVPKSYMYDGDEINNFRWMANDIAVVKTEDKFNFKRRIKGCEFIPKPIAYNNKSEDLERPGTECTVAGWGSTDRFGDTVVRNTLNSPVLLEADVQLTSGTTCRRMWDQQYHNILEKGIICGKDNMDVSAMSALCNEQQVNCASLIDSSELEDYRRDLNTSETRRSKPVLGGFCENDHGGPLIVGRGKNAIVIGTITASQVRHNNKCRGPYLFTSIYYHRHLISCAIMKEMGETCRRVIKHSNTKLEVIHIKWSEKPTGRSKLDKTSTNYLSGMKKSMTTQKQSFPGNNQLNKTPLSKLNLYKATKKRIISLF